MIRKASIKDITALVHIELNSGYEFRDSVDFNKELNRIKSDFRKGCEFFIDDKKRAYMSMLFKNKVCYLDYLCVIKSEHGNGLGNLFMEYVDILAKKIKCKKIILEVNEKNYVAINLYKKFGYKIIKNIKKEIHQNELTKLIMEKNLNLYGSIL